MLRCRFMSCLLIVDCFAGLCRDELVLCVPAKQGCFCFDRSSGDGLTNMPAFQVFEREKASKVIEEPFEKTEERLLGNRIRKLGRGCIPQQTGGYG